MDWLSKIQQQAAEAAELLISSEAAEKARQLAVQATQQATVLAQQATVKAQVGTAEGVPSKGQAGGVLVSFMRCWAVAFAGSRQGGDWRGREEHIGIQTQGRCRCCLIGLQCQQAVGHPVDACGTAPARGSSHDPTMHAHSTAQQQLISDLNSSTCGMLPGPGSGKCFLRSCPDTHLQHRHAHLEPLQCWLAPNRS